MRPSCGAAASAAGIASEHLAHGVAQRLALEDHHDDRDDQEQAAPEEEPAELLAPVPGAAPADRRPPRRARPRRRRSSGVGISLWARTSTAPRKTTISAKAASSDQYQGQPNAADQRGEDDRAREHGDRGRRAPESLPLAGERERMLVDAAGPQRGRGLPRGQGATDCTAHTPEAGSDRRMFDARARPRSRTGRCAQARSRAVERKVRERAGVRARARLTCLRSGVSLLFGISGLEPQGMGSTNVSSLGNATQGNRRPGQAGGTAPPGRHGEGSRMAAYPARRGPADHGPRETGT